MIIKFIKKDTLLKNKYYYRSNNNIPLLKEHAIIITNLFITLNILSQYMVDKSTYIIPYNFIFLSFVKLYQLWEPFNEITLMKE